MYKGRTETERMNDKKKNRRIVSMESYMETKPTYTESRSVLYLYLIALIR